MSDKCPACGQVKPKRPRSVDDHRRFFGVIRAAFKQWPEADDFQPDNEEHLRSFLLCKAGYRETVTVPFESDDPAITRLAVLAVEASIKAAQTYAFVRPHGTGVAIFTAKSLKFDTLDQKLFGPLREAVEAIIENTIGVKADALLKGEDAA
jgi:hypothetical protein